MKSRKTIDEGSFKHQLKDTRRAIPIQNKLEVLAFFEKLKQKKLAAKATLAEPRPSKKADVQKWRESRREARKVLMMSLQKECHKRYPSTVGSASVRRWAITARKEQWRQLPERVRARATATNNLWRTKIGARVKGRAVGGAIPMVLQKELDLLVMEMTSGFSAVASRRELVTSECIVPGLGARGYVSGPCWFHNLPSITFWFLLSIFLLQ